MRRSLDWLFRDRTTGRIVVAQWPNPPLWVFIVATAIRAVLHPHGAIGTAVSVIGTGALLVWAALEVARGADPFRRILGAVVLVGVVIGLVARAL
jgi:hypothetical protein